MSPKSVFRDAPRVIYRDVSLLSSSDASNLLQYAMHNVYSDHCLFVLASRGLWRSPEAHDGFGSKSSSRKS